MDKPKNILLTGEKGFVGKNLKSFLESVGHSIYLLPRNVNMEFYGTFDVIIHCAAELTDEDKMFNSNISFTKRLLDLAKQYKDIKFIQIGSSSEYGATNKIRQEDMACVPTNIYDATKLAATNLCIGYANRYDLDVCIARPFSLYGPGDTPRKFIPKLYDSLVNSWEFSLYEGSHDWIYIDDFIEGIYKLINAPKNITKGEIFNFGTGISTKNSQIIDLWIDMNKDYTEVLEINLIGDKYNKYDVDNWQADISKAKRLLDWEPKIELKEGLKRYIISRENNK